MFLGVILQHARGTKYDACVECFEADTTSAMQLPVPTPLHAAYPRYEGMLRRLLHRALPLLPMLSASRSPHISLPYPCLAPTPLCDAIAAFAGILAASHGPCRVLPASNVIYLSLIHI